ncbi:MAG TPA: hypothetical protein VLB73_02325 [Patescibacteria group bacterium]|nr:hypothetical protein [Patescibacteria group bacterium]
MFGKIRRRRSIEGTTATIDSTTEPGLKTVRVIGRTDRQDARDYETDAHDAGVPSRTTEVESGIFSVDIGPANSNGFQRFWNLRRLRGRG